MFKNQSASIDENKINHQDLSQEKDYSIEDIPIHTMAKDIQAIENPAMKSVLYPEKPASKIAFSELNAAQKSSPFLNPSGKAPFAEAVKIKTSPDYTQVNKAIHPKFDPISIKKASTNSNYLPIIIILFIILIVGAGIYYFTTTRKTTTEKESELTTTTDIIPSTETILSNQIEIIKDPPIPITAEKPNHLIINIAAVDIDVIKKSLEKGSQDVIASGLKTPIEFSVVDQQNNLIGFADFARMAGITLSEKTMALLEKDFRLFFFNDDGNAGLALSLKIINSSLLKNQLLQEETLLSEELATLLLHTNFTPPTTPFQSNQYKNTEIRYQNIISPQKLSIDYAFQEKNLLLATTKLTMEALLDKLSPQ